MEALYRRYKDNGFEILDFPSNEFGGQAPGTMDEIYAFIQDKYQATFPMFNKIEVNGDNTASLYTWLKSQANGAGDITWNFEKFLINKEGQLVKRYEPKVTPEEIEADIKALLSTE